MTLAVLLLAIVPQEPGIVREECGRLEYNSVHCDQTGDLRLTQLIGWDWHEDEGCWHVVFWRHAKRNTHYPRRDWEHGGWVVTFEDEGRLVQVRAASFEESWTTTDVELDDRQFYPKEQRRELRRR